MNGSAHKRIAMLSYAMVATIPTINSLAIFNNSLIHVPKGISLAGLALAGLGGLAVDADTQHSRINHMNPATAIANDAIGFVGTLLKTIIRLVIGMGLGVLIFRYSKVIIKEISTIKLLSHYASRITYASGILLIISSFINDNMLKSIPIIGELYSIFLASISEFQSYLQRAAMFIVYAGAGVLLIVYNTRHIKDPYLYIFGVLLIAIAIFPHRSFLHSVEGLIVFAISVSYLLNKIGYGGLTGAFIIGYASHIYWADIFTKEGVPLLSIPRFLAKLIRKFSGENGVEKVFEKIGNIRLRLIPHITTGSISGNMFEMGYVLVLLTIAVISYKTYGGGFRII